MFEYLSNTDGNKKNNSPDRSPLSNETQEGKLYMADSNIINDQGLLINFSYMNYLEYIKSMYNIKEKNNMFKINLFYSENKLKNGETEDFDHEKTFTDVKKIILKYSTKYFIVTILNNRHYSLLIIDVEKKDCFIFDSVNINTQYIVKWCSIHLEDYNVRKWVAYANQSDSFSCGFRCLHTIENLVFQLTRYENIVFEDLISSLELNFKTPYWITSIMNVMYSIQTSIQSNQNFKTLVPWIKSNKFIVVEHNFILDDMIDD